MLTTESIATAVDNSNWDGFLADDGSVARVREGQVAIVTAFGNLAVPAGATILGIEFDMEGYASAISFPADFLSVSNDGGTTFSTPKNINTEPFSTLSGLHNVEKSGGNDQLWGMSWDSTSANAIQYKIDFVDLNAGAVYFDYVLCRIYYKPQVSYTSSGDNLVLGDGTIVVNGGTLTIK